MSGIEIPILFAACGDLLIFSYFCVRDAGSGQDPLLIAKTRPFTAVGTATFPGHNFFFVQDTLNPWKKEVRYRFSVTGET